jgi:MFS family permease
MGYTEFYNFLIPLYGLSLGMSAGAIGMLVGARSLLAVFLSIHVGVLMDRFGTRRVTLFFVWTAMALAPVFPLLPWFWPLLLLQIVNGGALQFAWAGSQTLISQLAEGEAEYLGRFSFFARIGTTVAPMIAGVAWDLGGAWPSSCPVSFRQFFCRDPPIVPGQLGLPSPLPPGCIPRNVPPYSIVAEGQQ